jgi:hypothetical protein
MRADGRANGHAWSGAAMIAIAITISAAAPAIACAQRAEAAAQRATSDVERARSLYAEGLAAIDDGRWADALGAFRTSYELSGAAPALFNVALVLRGLGRMREARDTLDRLRTALADADASIAQVAAAMRAEAAARVAVLEVDGLPEPGVGRVLFDGTPLEDAGERPHTLEIDPGAHALSVVVPGFEPFAWQGTIGDGARERIEVRLVPHEDMPLWPWLVGGGALLAVGAVILGVVLGTQQSDLTWPTFPRAE